MDPLLPCPNTYMYIHILLFACWIYISIIYNL